MLAHPPGEGELLPLGLGRAALGDHLHLAALLEVEVAVLDQQAADDLAQMRLDHVRGPALAVVEDPGVGLLGQHLERLVVVAAGEQDLDELIGERLGQLGVDPAVEAARSRRTPTCGSHANARR